MGNPSFDAVGAGAGSSITPTSITSDNNITAGSSIDNNNTNPLEAAVAMMGAMGSAMGGGDVTTPAHQQQLQQQQFPHQYMYGISHTAGGGVGANLHRNPNENHDEDDLEPHPAHHHPSSYHHGVGSGGGPDVDNNNSLPPNKRYRTL